jgi:hypothetical protein
MADNIIKKPLVSVVKKTIITKIANPIQLTNPIRNDSVNNVIVKSNEGTIYLLKMCDTSGRCIYKVGKSINFDNRYKNYNYADILTLVKSTNIDDDEKEIIKIFNKNFTLDKGNEFFIHNNENNVMFVFMNYFNRKYDKQNIKIVYSTNETQYKEYKFSLLGVQVPDRKDPYCEFYYLTGAHVKHFLKIKQFGLNLKIDHSHIDNMVSDLLESTNPCFFGHIGIIEYNDYNSNTIDNLIEVIDGHHRIMALEKIFAMKPDFNISLWVGLHKSDNPDSEQTRTIFKKYNQLKPFIVDVSISEISGKIIAELNKKFSSADYIFIKDSEYVCRPSVKKCTINKMIQRRLETLKKEKNIEYNKVNVPNIIKKFEECNTLFSSKNIDWFSSDTVYKNKKAISQNMLDYGKKYKCCLALVEVNALVDNCIL